MATNLLNPGCDPCYDCCPVVWTFHDCRLYWRVTNPPGVDYTVTITGPGSYSEVIENLPSGTISEPATGTWTATLSVDGDSDIVCEIEITACEPDLPCCIGTESVAGVFAGVTTKTTQSVTGGSGGFPWTLQSWRFEDFTDANVSWLRDLVMVSGTKTESNCYNSFGYERILIGTAVYREYIKINGPTKPTGGSEPTWTEAEVTASYSYWLRDTAYDVFLDFDGDRVRTVSKVTSSTVTNYGSTPPGPDPVSVGTESNIVDSPSIVGRQYLFGACGYEFFAIGGGRTIEYWPVLI